MHWSPSTAAGLDSATTFNVTKWLRVITHALQLTTVVSLLQPAPEVFRLFDDVLLLTDGCARSRFVFSHHLGAFSALRRN